MDKIEGVQLVVKNLKQAESFYSKLFGWKLKNKDKTEVGKKEVEYIVMEAGGIDCILVEAELGKNSSVVYVKVENVKETLDNAEKLGGKIMGKSGDMDFFEDPYGNPVGVF